MADVNCNAFYESESSVNAELFHLYGNDIPGWYISVLRARLKSRDNVLARECHYRDIPPINWGWTTESSKPGWWGCSKDCLHCSHDIPLIAGNKGDMGTFRIVPYDEPHPYYPWILQPSRG
jgi:hypothetical protein